MNVKLFQCKNCNGYQHKSNECPIAPRCRRCFTCGISGSRHHRQTCTDKWYDLCGKVPKNADGSIMERAECIKIMFAEFQSQKVQSPQPIYEVDTVTVDSESDGEAAGETIEYDEQKFDTGKNGESSDEKSDTESEDTDFEWGENDEIELVKWKSLEIETLETLATIRNRIDILSQFKEQAAVDLSKKNREANQPAEKRKTEKREILEPPMKTLAVSAMLPSPPSRPFLFSMQFEKVNQLFIAENMRHDVEVSKQPIRLQGGLWMNFTGSKLEIRGIPTRETRFQMLSVGDSYRVNVAINHVEIEERFRLTNEGLLIQTARNFALPAVPEHGVTLFGPAQKVIRLQYRSQRFMMRCGEMGMDVMPIENE